MSIETEFPDYDVSTLPVIPVGLTDVSWHSDACPCFVTENENVLVWIDYANAADREFPLTPRYVVCYQNGDPVYEGDDWNEALAALNGTYPKRT